MLEAASGKSGAAFSCRRQRGCCCPFCSLLTFFMYEKYKKERIVLKNIWDLLFALLPILYLCKKHKLLIRLLFGVVPHLRCFVVFLQFKPFFKSIGHIVAVRNQKLYETIQPDRLSFKWKSWSSLAETLHLDAHGARRSACCVCRCHNAGCCGLWYCNQWL